MARTTLKRPHRKPCIGHLRDRVDIHQRRLTAPAFGLAEATEEFTAKKNIPASIQTLAGVIFYDSVNGADVTLTHRITIRFDADVTAESWVELNDSTLVDIVDVDNLEERNEWMILRCSKRGPKDRKAAQA